MAAERNAELNIGTTLQGEPIELRCKKQSLLDLLDQGFLHTTEPC